MNSELKNTTFIDACWGKPTSHTPIWIMRQAGRYMKEYRDVRKQVGFLELCYNPELVCKVTTEAADILNVDAAIIFADILLITQAMGFDLTFGEGVGPVISNPFRHEQDLQRVKTQGMTEFTQFLGNAVNLTLKELNNKIPLIGFAGAPFTVASYCVEGKSSRNFDNIKSLMFGNPKLLHQLLEKITQATIEYLDVQLKAGCHTIQLFDSWIGCLDEAHADTFAVPYAKRIFAYIQKNYPEVPTIYFGAHTSHLMKRMNASGCSVLGVDYHSDIAKVWNQTQAKAVQGNLDPTVLCSTPEAVKRETSKVLEKVAGKPGHIFNLGHGILPSTPVEHAKLLVDWVHEKTSQS